jgi:ankyrin repeat protein
LERVVLLLEKGADAAKRCSAGRSPLEWAETARRPKVHHETLRLLAEVEKGIAERSGKDWD